jgi:hypothetical protein
MSCSAITVFRRSRRKKGEAMEENSVVKEKATLKVFVTYPAAKKPFEQGHARRDETVGTLKSAALKAFGLTEGQGDGGQTFTYTLYFEKRPLENLQETLGEVAGHEDELKLKLSQQVTQG